MRQRKFLLMFCIVIDDFSRNLVLIIEVPYCLCIGDLRYCVMSVTGVAWRVALSSRDGIKSSQCRLTGRDAA